MTKQEARQQPHLYVVGKKQVQGSNPNKQRCGVCGLAKQNPVHHQDELRHGRRPEWMDAQ